MTDSLPFQRIPYALLCGMVSHFYGDRLQAVALYGDSLPTAIASDVPRDAGDNNNADTDSDTDTDIGTHADTDSSADVTDHDVPLVQVLIVARTMPIGGNNRLMEFDMIRQQLPEWFQAMLRPVFYTGDELAIGRPVFLQDNAPVAILRDDGTLQAALGLGPGQKPPRPTPQGPAPRRRRRRG